MRPSVTSRPLSSLLLLLCVTASHPAGAQTTRSDYQRALAAPRAAQTLVPITSIQPRWAADGNSFWYKRASPDGKAVFISINALSGERTVLDAPPNAADSELSPLEPREISRSPHSSQQTEILFENATPGVISLFWINFEGQKTRYFSLNPGEKRGQNTFSEHLWTAEAENGKTLGVWRAASEPARVRVSGEIPPGRSDPAPPNPQAARKTPADWKPFLRDHNLWVKHRQTLQEIQLSSDGTASSPYQHPLPSPDGIHAAALQIQKTPEPTVHLIESAPKDRLQPKLLSLPYRKPGDAIDHPRIRLFDLVSPREIAVSEELFANPWNLENLHWSPDGKSLRFLYNERGHQVQRMLAVDASSGRVQTLVEETSSTFIDYSQKTFAHWLNDTGELIWASERSGWNHLWLVDARTGAVKNPITSGPWVVRGVERVDAKARQIWFRCSGFYPDQDPYYLHLARVNFDGSGLTLLTSSHGTHALREGGSGGRRLWQSSPDERFLIVSHSRVDLPPVTELRRTADGSLVCVLEQTDASALLASGWRAPERFHAKGRDGRTDIHGIILRPNHFEPGRKYPVIESIYAGPHGHFVPKEWSPAQSQRILVELGFIVVQIDGMGTNWRSKAFHDVAWKNLKDSGFPDRIAWMKAAAELHPEMDLTRVGIYGGSAGGQSALSALLHHGDFYRAAAADCGCHDNRMDKIWWNEAWMGWPPGPEYAESSNVVHAAKLRGKLLLTVGELDKNVDPASTMQVVRALIDADKDFELLVMPGAGHGAGESPYAARRRMAFFVCHLMGLEPAWN